MTDLLVPSLPAPSATEAGVLRLLVLDDDEVDRLTVRRLLARTTLTEVSLIEATDANAARRVLETAQPPVDCVILDYNLAGETGLEVLTELRSRYPDLAVVVLTGQTDPETVAALMKAGALDFLSKDGLRPERLEHGIRGAMRVARAEMEAREFRERLAATLRSIADAVFTVDREGRVVYLNVAAENLTGWRSEAAIGRRLDEITPAADPGATAQLADRVRAVIEGGANQESALIQVRAANDRTLEVETTAAPLRAAGGEVNGAVIALHDITDRRNAERAAEQARAAAEQANRAKSEFLANMSHELRTPLNAIGGYADLLITGIRGPISEEQRADLGRIKRNQHHLLSLINDILNFAKIEAGRVQMKPTDVSMNDVLGQLEPLIGPQLLEKQLRYEYYCCDPRFTAHVDPERLQQILLNLLSNAAKFTPPGGRIVVQCDATADAMVVEVSDTGIGIPEDKIESIFEPFVQLDRARWNNEVGTGLGLAISRDLARAMGGELTARSAVDAGSTFTLTVPRRRGVTLPRAGAATHTESNRNRGAGA